MPTHTLGRVTLDDAGIRRGKLFGLFSIFGAPFEVSWSELTGWAVGADSVMSRKHPEGVIVQWILEIDVGDATHVIRWGRAEEPFHAMVGALHERVSELRRGPRVGRSYNGRLPPSLRWMAGPEGGED